MAAPPGAREVSIDGAENAWVVEQPASNLPGTLVIVGNNQSFKANFEGTSDAAIAAAQRTLHFN